MPTFAVRFAEGVDHFNAGRFWEAHESWEVLWLPARTDMRQFLQGLIQLAAAYLHLGRSNLSGSIRLYDAALSRLEGFPAEYCGVDLESLLRKAVADRAGAAQSLESIEQAHGARLSDSPRLILAQNWDSKVPQGERW
ncbi:MAG TPA: DUF309 domain-containing protein [Thermoanaerobaculia bacterium]|nr:DUF309 domain-containing protein [Thermoanaerobaculia bacterium]